MAVCLYIPTDGKGVFGFYDFAFKNFSSRGRLWTATDDKGDSMEEVTRAIEISADIATLIPYLQQRELLQQWMHPFIENQVVVDLAKESAVGVQHVEVLRHYWQTVRTEFWASERRQIFVVAFPPPAPQRTYFIEVHPISAGVMVVAKIHFPDTISGERIETQKTTMAEALACLKKMIEGKVSAFQPRPHLQEDGISATD